MAKLIVWDVDTQVDFMYQHGKLYVQDAEQIIPNLEKLTVFAERMALTVIADEDYHTLDDAEISEEPDFDQTYPSHCLQGTSGQSKIPATQPRNPLYIESESYKKSELLAEVRRHKGEIVFRKQHVDVFSNLNVDLILKEINPTDIVIYGVAQDICVRYVVEGLLQRGRYTLYAVEDAMKPINAARGQQLFEEWSRRGVTVLSTQDVIEGTEWASLLKMEIE